MIIRILSEGQFDVADDRIDELNVLDDRVQAAVDSGDDAEFTRALSELLAFVRRLGVPLADSTLIASEFVLPAEDASLDDVRAMLGDEGLVPG